MSNPGNLSVHERIRQEHEELRELLGKVHRTLARRLKSVASVAEMLQTLHRHVQSHFEDEENDGFFEDVVIQAPRLSERADAVKQEHAWLNNAMHEMVECAEDANRDDWWQRLEAKFHEFSKQLMHHENKEHELLQEAYIVEIGAPD